jgi:prolipoprotein diacylglyceryltransferase
MGFFFGGITMGQILSLPLIIAGLWLIWHAVSRPAIELQPQLPQQ